MAAANTHEGEGRRKKRKEKREAEARERAELEAIERGLDPTLVLDDSVVEIPQGASVAKFAELLGVQPNDVIKRLFMLGQVLTLTQTMSDETMELIADDMGRKVRVVSPEEEYAVVYNDSEADLKPRPPVVTVMGHGRPRQDLASGRHPRYRRGGQRGPAASPSTSALPW